MMVAGDGAMRRTTMCHRSLGPGDLDRVEESRSSVVYSALQIRPPVDVGDPHVFSCNGGCGGKTGNGGKEVQQ